MAAPPTMDQLVQIIAQQQAQITQLQNAHQGNDQGAVAAQTFPALPDIQCFEPGDEKSRIADWLKRFKFSMDCTVPNASDEIGVNALMNKLSEEAFSEYNKSCLPKDVTDFTFE